MDSKIYSAMVTPFNDLNQIDYEVLFDLLCEIAKTHDGVLIGGSTGEGDSLCDNELQDLIDFVKPFILDKIVAISEDNTASVIVKIGKLNIPLDYKILLRVPSYYLPTQHGIFEHFNTIFKQFKNYEFLIYNIPKRTGSKIDFITLKDLVDSNPNIVGIKDCSLDFDFISKASLITKVYSGVDDKFYDYLKNGASGIISVMSIIYPTMFIEIRDHFKSSIKPKRAIKFIKEITEKWKYASNPIPLKRALSQQGYRSMKLRLPLTYF